MREIKFRAWDKGPEYSIDDELDKPRMIYDIQSFYDTDEFSSFGSFLNDERFVIMQYTGLKDKNGKEIYEGNIIANGDTHGEDEEVVHECVFSDGAFVFDPFPKGNREDPLIGYEEFLHTLSELEERGECEVIGNIHENPELLTKTED